MSNPSWPRQPRRLWRWLRLPMAVLLIGGAAWFVRSRPIPVEVAAVRRGDVVRTVMGTGTLEARVRTTISPKIPGRIAELLVDQGALVTAGQLLARLDDEDLTQQVRIATAGINTSEATLGRFRAEVEQAKISFAKNESDLTRFRKLIQEGSVSQSEFDRIQEGFDLAQAGLLRAEANLLEAEQQVLLNRETLKYHEARLADSRLVAPFDGLIIARERDPGAIVVPGSPILQLVSLDELWISAWVDETEIDTLQENQPAQIVFRSEPERSLEGSVARLGKQADRETREFTVDVRVLELPKTWAIGQRAEVFVEIGRQQACPSVPTSFLARRNGTVGAFVHRQGKAHWVDVTTGLEGRDTVEVISGLEGDDQLLRPVARNVDLHEGRRVQLP